MLMEKAGQSLPVEGIRGFVLGHKNVTQDSCLLTYVQARSHRCDMQIRESVAKN